MLMAIIKAIKEFFTGKTVHVTVNTVPTAPYKVEAPAADVQIEPAAEQKPAVVRKPRAKKPAVKRAAAAKKAAANKPTPTP